MNYGPLVFLAAFFALATSWCGFVLTPQLLIGRLQQTNTISGAAVTYPVARPGLACQGLEVYRANGCAYCHSQQVGQSGTVLEISLTDAGTNQAATITALLNLAQATNGETTVWTALPALELRASSSAATNLLSGLPKAFLRGSDPTAAKAAVKALNSTSAKAQLLIVPVGPDLARGWGKRRTVAEDFLFDSPVMPGSQRVGPDLADVGTRLPNVQSHLVHLYAPRLVAEGSAMPSYRFLFEKRAIEHGPSPEALVLSGKSAPPPGYEVVPKPAARALAAYLVSLHVEVPLFDAPMTVASAATSTPTNSPAISGAAATNAAPATAPAK
jgi:cbb3-type cytochrome oxidase cytochrome c subunit